jgi:hypothetical protein
MASSSPVWRNPILRALPAAVALSTLVGCAAQVAVPVQPDLRVSPGGAPHQATSLFKSDQEMASELVESPSGDVWSLWCSGDGSGTLRRINPQGAVTTFPVTRADGPSCATSRIAFTADGAVWASLNYTLWRLDPASGKVTGFPLDRTVDGQLPTATDQGSPVKGTWISALAASGTSVEVARVNVPFLTVVDAGGKASRGDTLPTGFAGAKRMTLDKSGNLVVLPGFEAAAGGRLAVSNGTTVVDLTQAVTDPTARASSNATVPSLVWALGPQGRIAVWDRASNSVRWTTNDGDHSTALGTVGGPFGHQPDLTPPTNVGEIVLNILSSGDGERTYILRAGGRQVDLG